MDFGLLGLDGLVSSETNTNSTVFASSDPEAKQKWYGSGNLKQERSSIADDDNGRSSKMLKMDDNNSNISASKTMLFHQKNSGSSFFPDVQQPAEQMLSFTSPKSDGLLLGRTAQNVTLPYLQYSSVSAYNRNSGYNWGSANMHGAVTATRGPFTPSQWMELEHQALIYKYILANVPVPSNLLIPIKKALESAGFPSFSGGILRPNTLGWGSFHLGFSNSTDPEPGRCRRTDGKKWRCSRDAVADQKYCERHMNRGRHRSRKPVEGQNGHSATGTTTTNSKLMPTALSSASVVASGGASNSLTSANQQVKDMQTGASNHPAASSMNRMFLNSENVGDRMVDTPGLSMLSSGDLKYKENPFLIGKQQIPCGEFSPAAFGLVSSDALVNPSHKGNSMVNCRDLSSQDPNAGAGSQSLRHFMDDWPKNQSDRAAVSWPDLDMQQDRTQLSMSIPMASADFMSSTSSPINEKVTLSPLRLSRELDPIQMGLGVGSVVNEPEQRQANCMPISWEQSMGGPLGEVLHSTNNSGSDGKNSSSSLNLTTEGWDSNPWTGSSPTGVLQKSTFGSLSNSSAGSSPRTENKTHEGASHCKEILNSTPGNSSSVPAL